MSRLCIAQEETSNNETIDDTLEKDKHAKVLMLRVLDQPIQVMWKNYIIILASLIFSLVDRWLAGMWSEDPNKVVN